jgi:hypothetical protein
MIHLLMEHVRAHRGALDLSALVVIERDPKRSTRSMRDGSPRQTDSRWQHRHADPPRTIMN